MWSIKESVNILRPAVQLYITLTFLHFLRRQWACEPGATALSGDQPAGHGPGCGHLQRSGHRAAGPAGPVCHLLQETAAGEEAQR